MATGGKPRHWLYRQGLQVMIAEPWRGPDWPKNPPSNLQQTTIDLPPPPSVNRIRRLNKTEMHFYARWLDACSRTVTKQWADAKLRGTSRPSFGEAKVCVLVQLNEKMKLRDADNA